MIINSENFYNDLHVLHDFTQIAGIQNYVRMPEDWYVAVTDVINSTEAIENGKYKEINTVGASSIIAILNLNRSFSLPFIFGGDGAVVCVPPSFYKRTCKALAGLKKMAKEGFGFDLRAGIVPVKDIYASGNQILIAKYEVSKDYVQAMFAGGGISYAEKCIKESARYAMDINDEVPEADFDGLQCRWENVPGSRGEVVSIIVEAVKGSPVSGENVYVEVINKIAEVYGEDKVCMPIAARSLKLSLDNKILDGELKVKYYNRLSALRIMFNAYQKASAVVGEILFKTGIYAGRVHWDKFKNEVVANTDYRKFDDKLRLVISGSEEQRNELKEFLEKKYREGILVYGIHNAPRALITCLIFDYNGQHIHLIDSENGGYALAAKAMKDRAKSLKQYI